MRGRSFIVATALVAGLVHAGSLAAGELRWGGSDRSELTPRGSFRSGQSSPARSGSAGSHHGWRGGKHHGWHGGKHHDWHKGFHFSPREGWHSGRHHGAHAGVHHDWRDRSRSFEHRQGFRFRGKTHGFSFGLHAHESGSRSSFGAAGSPPWGAAGPPPFAAGRAPVVFISTPFFCHPHGLGFTSEAEFVQHLVGVHGRAERSALGACRPVGGKLFYFGF